MKAAPNEKELNPAPVVDGAGGEGVQAKGNQGVCSAPVMAIGQPAGAEPENTIEQNLAGSASGKQEHETLHAPTLVVAKNETKHILFKEGCLLLVQSS